VLTHFRRAGNDPEIFEELRGGEKASSKLSSCQQKRRAPNYHSKVPFDMYGIRRRTVSGV